MSANTAYIIRTGGPEPSYLRHLDGGSYAFCGKPARAARFPGKAAAREALAALESAIAANGYPVPRLLAAPARGGAPIAR